MKQAPEFYRLKTGPFGTDASYGNNGIFIFPHYKIADCQIRCIISDGAGWEHVSVTIRSKTQEATRNPTWDEMCWIKAQFWGDDECVIEYHPPKSEYVSQHPFCLHLWRPIGISLPLPASIMVGRSEFKKK